MAARAFYDPERPPNVAIDVRMWRHSGIGSYIRGLMNAFARMDAHPRFCCLGPSEFAEAAAALRPEWESQIFNRGVYGLGEQLAPARFRPEWALYHHPHYNFPVRWPDALPLVVTIHDLIHLSSDSFLKRAYMRWFLKRLESRPPEGLRVITGSQATLRALLEAAPALGRDPRIVRHIPYGVSPLYLNARPARDELEDWRRRRQLPPDYLLMVGNALPHKNHAFVLKALLPRIRAQKLDCNIVLCGMGERGMAELLEIATRVWKRPRLHCLPHLPQKEMPLLYASARVLVFPSLMEGFGLPVVEAQAVGTPVAASDIPPVREAGGEAAVYFDPSSPKSLASAVRRALEDKEWRAEAIERGLVRTREMTWGRAAERTLEVYESVADLRRGGAR
jgi:glycosyltransferase involved in cell wall biosynthesis